MLRSPVNMTLSWMGQTIFRRATLTNDACVLLKKPNIYGSSISSATLKGKSQRPRALIHGPGLLPLRHAL